MLDGRWRAKVERALRPFGRGLQRLRVSPDVLTAFGLLCSLATAVLIGGGYLGLGLLGVILSGVGDLLDGAVARGTGRTSPRGAFFDSVADRVSDAAVLGGVAYYLAERNPHLPVLAFAVGAMSMVISYERAKAESLGLQARGGLMERAERFVLVGLGLAYSSLLVPILWVMLVLTSLTAIGRFRRVWLSADRPAPAAPTALTHRPPRANRPSDSVDRAAAPALRTWWEARRPRRERPTRHSTRRATRP